MSFMKTLRELARERRSDFQHRRITTHLRGMWNALYDVRDEIMESLQSLTEKSDANLALAQGLQTSIDAFQASNTALQEAYDAVAAELQALKDSNQVDAALLEPLGAKLDALSTALTTLQTDVSGAPTDPIDPAPVDPAPVDPTLPNEGGRTNITGRR